MKIQNNFYNIIPHTNLLHVEIFSAWDERVAKDYSQKIQSVILKFYAGKKWAMLADCKNWELNTPEAEKFMITFAMNAKRDSTLTHLAVLVEESEIKKWQIEKQIQNSSQFITEFLIPLKRPRIGWHPLDIECLL